VGKRLFIHLAIDTVGDEFSNLLSGFTADTLHLAKLIGRSAVDPLNRPEVREQLLGCSGPAQTLNRKLGKHLEILGL